LTGLLAGFARRDLDSVTRNAAALLASGGRYTPRQREFLLVALMLGAFTGKQAEAAHAWQEFAPEIFPEQSADLPFPLQVLLAHVRAGLRE
jgi:hypothetical protein